MEVVVRIPEDSIYYWCWLNDWEMSNGCIGWRSANGEPLVIKTFEDFVRAEIMAFIDDDKYYDLACEYLEDYANEIVSKHPEAATALADFIK